MDSRSNLAHDFRQFEEREVPVKPQIKQVKKSKNATKTLSMARAVSYLLIAIVMLSMLIYSRAMQAEIDAEYSKTTKGISKIMDDNSHLKIKLESKMSLKNIEDIATSKLDLVKLDDRNIEYLNLNIENKAQVIKPKTLWTNVSDWFSGLFH